MCHLQLIEIPLKKANNIQKYEKLVHKTFGLSKIYSELFASIFKKHALVMTGINLISLNTIIEHLFNLSKLQELCSNHKFPDKILKSTQTNRESEIRNQKSIALNSLAFTKRQRHVAINHRRVIRDFIHVN